MLDMKASRIEFIGWAGLDGQEILECAFGFWLLLVGKLALAASTGFRGLTMERLPFEGLGFSLGSRVWTYLYEGGDLDLGLRDLGSWIARLGM